VLHSIEDDITSRWNADYVERHLGGPVTKILLDNCYHMITVDLQYRRVIELSAEFISRQVSCSEQGCGGEQACPALGCEAAPKPAIAV
jgi:carboxylesterase